MGITYHAVAEKTALLEKVIDRVEYVWRDHWILVGMVLFEHFSYSSSWIPWSPLDPYLVETRHERYCIMQYKSL